MIARPKTIKAKKCRVCRTDFHSSLPMAKVCGKECAESLAVSKRVKAKKVADIKEAKADRARKEAIKPRSKWLAEAKTAVQQSRRLEELAKGRGCISCKRSQAEVMGADGWKLGGAWDGGHFLSKGACPELALEPRNVWLQCKSCNAGSGKYARKGHTVNASFRENLIELEGAELVDWLEGPHALNHFTVDDLKAIKTEHNAKSREIKKGAV